ncbi:acyltransferase family protein [Alteromonas lipotrueiana]|uniref:acyltransferase family protein n=1 Tax=Alteromonas lipotrueiana TaxID=2803815 RepID=UPI001C44FA4A|nr:acyltransferase [Alteromonas lipotrueiana]
MFYRKEIDGLRALAILPVIWLHADLPYLSGGYLGVDVFFIISGFLITSIIVHEINKDKFSLISFYERRARRILPALLFVIAVTSIFVPLVSSNPDYLNSYGLSVLSTLAFSSNLYFWQTSGYFGSVSELSPMLHTWSLAVEEQFYIFFPLVTLFLLPLGKKKFFYTLLVFLAISLVIAQWGASYSPTGNFYLLPSRGWELLAGAIAALIFSGKRISLIKDTYKSALSMIGFLLIIVSYFLFDASTPHPSFLTLLPVAGTALILLFSNEKNFIGKALSNKVLTTIGLLSYSLYLWHQPILALMKKSYSEHLSVVQILFAVTLTFILSYISWRFIENPFRKKNKFSQGFIFKTSLFSILVFFVIGAIFKENLHIQRYFYPSEMTRFDKINEAKAAHANQTMFDNGQCKFWSPVLDEKFVQRFADCAEKHRRAVFILGGSHGMDLYNAIALNSANHFVVSVSRGFCRAHDFLEKTSNLPKCQYEDFKTFSERYKNSISLVLYTQTPDRLFSVNSLDKASPDTLSKTSMDEVVTYLASLKNDLSLDVMMIGMLPPLNKSPIDWDYRLPFSKQYEHIISPNSILLTKLVDKEFKSKLAKHSIPYISKFEGFALNLPEDLHHSGNITYSDNRHISYYGEKLFGRKLVQYLNKNNFKQLSPLPENNTQ